MKTGLAIVQIILSLLLIVLIFLQAGNSSDTSSNFLSSTTSEKRGWEKILFTFTLLILGIFLISSVIQTII